jgi:hypothetical protein
MAPASCCRPTWQWLEHLLLLSSLSLLPLLLQQELLLIALGRLAGYLPTLLLHVALNRLLLLLLLLLLGRKGRSLVLLLLVLLTVPLPFLLSLVLVMLLCFFQCCHRPWRQEPYTPCFSACCRRNDTSGPWRAKCTALTYLLCKQLPCIGKCSLSKLSPLCYSLCSHNTCRHAFVPWLHIK